MRRGDTTRPNKFLSTPSARRATASRFGTMRATTFLSTPSARRATVGVLPDERDGAISIHALREEGDPCLTASYRWSGQFLSTPSARRATSIIDQPDEVQEFLSTPSARRATHIVIELRQRRQISIHALREEGDVSIGRGSPPTLNFYPRPPRGGRHTCASLVPTSRPFLSTPSARRATGLLIAPTRCLCNFYPRPPRGGRPHPVSVRFAMGKFLSTPSARRATPPEAPAASNRLISIHALREEGDVIRHCLFPSGSNFYPRPPRGGRPNQRRVKFDIRNFYPRPPRGGRPPPD